MLKDIARKDIRSVTGKNYRNIMLLAKCASLGEVEKYSLENLCYFPLKEEDKWKVDFIKEIIDVIHGQLEIPGIESSELHNLLEDLCTS